MVKKLSLVAAGMAATIPAWAVYTPQDYSSAMGDAKTEVLAQISAIAPMLLTVGAVMVGLRMALRLIHHFG